MDGGKSQGDINEAGKAGRSIIDEGTGGENRGKNTSTPDRKDGGKDGGKEKQGNPKLVMVGDPEAAPDEAKEKAKKKAESKKKKTQNTKQQKKEAEIKDLQDTLSLLIKSGFDMAALRLGPIWELTPEEVKNITGPLARIIDRQELTSAANEYGDYIALTLAVVMTTAPRIILHQEMKKGGRTIEPTGKNQGRNPENNEGNEFIPPGGGNVKKFVPGLG